MEQINTMSVGTSSQITKCVQSCNLASRLTTDIHGNKNVSVYNDTIASAEDIKTAVHILSVAFPRQGQQAVAFNTLLAREITSSNMTAKRLSDSVSRLLKEHVYNTFTIADVVGFDRKVRLYTYGEYCDACFNKENVSKDFAVYAKIDGETLFYRKSELAKIKAQQMQSI